MLQKMKELGLQSVAIGVESADETILKNIKKGESLSQIENAIKTCISLDINVLLFFIIGLPGETKESVEKSFEFALKYPVSNAHFFNINPLPKTELYKWAEENNYLLILKDDMFKNIGGMSENPLIATPELSYDERKELYKKGLLISKKVRSNSSKKYRLSTIKNRLACILPLRFKKILQIIGRRYRQIRYKKSKSIENMYITQINGDLLK